MNELEESRINEGKFKLVHRYPDFSPYSALGPTITCSLYYELKGVSEDCKYPYKKCERCPVFNGFNGNERYKLLLQKLILGE